MKKISGLILFLLIPLSISALEITEQELTELERILTEQDTQIEALKEQLKTARTQLNTSTSTIEKLKKSYNEYEKEAESVITDLRAILAAKEREIHGLQAGLGISLVVNMVQGGVLIGCVLKK